MSKMNESQLKKQLKELPSPASQEWFEQTMHNLEVYATVEEGVTKESDPRTHSVLHKLYLSFYISY